jgi:hypothetical protein
VWRREYGDLGCVAEDELLERGRPGGSWTTTATPVVRVVGGCIAAGSETEGARVVWTTDAPGDDEPVRPPSEADHMGSPAVAIGSPPYDGRAWKLLCDATPPPLDADVWIKACRLGFADSDEIHVTARQLSPN